MAGTLIAHCGAQRVSRQELHCIVPPPPTNTWRPVAHNELMVAVEAELARRSLTITRESYAVQREGALLFGVLDLAWQHTNEFAAAIGIRTSNDKSISLQLAVGLRVFVCDNLSFSGDLIALNRRHTSGLDLAVELASALDRYQNGFQTLSHHVDRLKNSLLTDRQAKLLIYRAFEQAIMPVRFFSAVHGTYFAPEHQRTEPALAAFSERSLWSLHNSFTHHVKTMAPGPAFRATVNLGKLFGLGKAVNA